MQWIRLDVLDVRVVSQPRQRVGMDPHRDGALRAELKQNLGPRAVQGRETLEDPALAELHDKSIGIGLLGVPGPARSQQDDRQDQQGTENPAARSRMTRAFHDVFLPVQAMHGLSPRYWVRIAIWPESQSAGRCPGVAAVRRRSKTGSAER
jgi:hypothetical protein